MDSLSAARPVHGLRAVHSLPTVPWTTPREHGGGPRTWRGVVRRPLIRCPQPLRRIRLERIDLGPTRRAARGGSPRRRRTAAADLSTQPGVVLGARNKVDQPLAGGGMPRPHERDHPIHPRRSRLRHPATGAGRAKSSSLAGKWDQLVLRAGLAGEPGEPVLGIAALQVALHLGDHMPWQRALCLREPLPQPRPSLRHHVVEEVAGRSSNVERTGHPGACKQDRGRRMKANNSLCFGRVVDR